MKFVNTSINDVKFGTIIVNNIYFENTKVWSKGSITYSFYAEFKTNGPVTILIADIGNGVDFEWSDDGGITWTPETPGTGTWTPTGGSYMMRKATAINIEFASAGHGANYTGTIIVRGKDSTSTENMFRGLSNVTNIDIAGFACLSSNMNSTFQDCSSITSIYNKYLFSSMATTTSNTFNGCSNLVCINNISTTSSTDKTDMFLGCDALLRPNDSIQADLMSINGDGYISINCT